MKLRGLESSRALPNQPPPFIKQKICSSLQLLRCFSLCYAENESWNPFDAIWYRLKEKEMSRSTYVSLASILARLWQRHARQRGRFMALCALVGISLAVAACGKALAPRANADADGIHVSVTLDIETDPDQFTPETPSGDEARILSSEEALRRDAERYAEEMGITLDEAMRRFQYMDDIGQLNAALTANEHDSFAGLWVEHQPDFRVIVLFTRRGERTIRPYIKDKSWAHLVEVRKASVTYAELQAVQAETIQALDKLAFEVSCSLDVKGNRVEVWVTDREWFERELEKADIDLPKHVELVVIEGHSVQEIDICATPSVPGVAFPRQEPVEGIRVTMAAELIGDLVLVDGCLRVNSIYGEVSYLLIWPPEFTLRAEDDESQVLDGDGQVMARVGQEVYVGGGEGSAASMPGCVREQLPAACTGPYWIVGDTVRPNLRHDSELFSLDVISATERSLLFLGKTPVLDEWAEEDAPLIGKLVLYDDQRCPRVKDENGLIDYLPIWPPDHRARVENGQVEIVNGSGQVVARVGEEVRLDGGRIPIDWDSGKYRQLLNELPGDCNGPYWVVENAALTAVPTMAPAQPTVLITVVAPETYVDPELGFWLTYAPSWHLEARPGTALNDGSGKTIILVKDGYQFKLKIQNRPKVVGRCAGLLPEDAHLSFWEYTIGDLPVWRIKAEEGLINGYHDSQCAFISIVSPIDDRRYTCSLQTHGQVLGIDYMLPVSADDIRMGRFRSDILAEMDYILDSISWDQRR